MNNSVRAPAYQGEQATADRRYLRCHPSFFRREISQKRVPYLVQDDQGIQVQTENWKNISLTLDDRLPTEGYYA